MTYVIPKFEGEYRFLSNFAPSPINVAPQGNQMTFPTGEHLFQALKAHAMPGDNSSKVDYVLAIASNPDPNHAKQMGRKVTIDTWKWNDIRIEKMRMTVWEKFKQNDDLRDRLIATGAAMLVEGNTWGDKFWGRVDGQGNNLLGSILMEVRGYYVWKDQK